MNNFKQQCVVLRSQDHTLPEIVKITGRPKTSVYFHIRDIPLSTQKLRMIQDASRTRIIRMSENRKGKSSRSFKEFSTWNTNMVLLISHFLFDGEINTHGCIYNNRSTSLIKRVETIMKEIYDFEPTRYCNKSTGVLRISYFNVALAAHIKKKSQELFSNVNTFPKHLKREFLRAFFDDEGCMNFNNRSRRVRGYQKDTSVLETIKILLLDFDIGSSIQKPNEVVIVGKENLQKFQKEINFSPGVCINGNRSNSIWKQNLEKREILERAIASYQ
ncbi:hypothetical protein IID26_00745 [Patescibacteria group bacterium]|nr:hypothetical protein [Patescibacteria group bacterium]